MIFDILRRAFARLTFFPPKRRPRENRIEKSAAAKKIPPNIRFGAGMFLQKAGEKRQAQSCYRQVADQYRTRDTLSSADRINYAFALILSGEKETARRTIDSLITDTLARKQLLHMTENPQEALEGLFP